MAYKGKNIVIIGSGVAAMSLSATLKLAKINHIILEQSNKCGGMLGEIHNELDDFVIGVFNNGKEIEQAIMDFNKKYNLPIQYDSRVTLLDTVNKSINYIQSGKPKSVDYDYAVIATGSRFKILEEFQNKKFQKDIYYRISPFLNDFYNKKVAVVGSGDNATIAALRLTEYAKEIFLINKSEKWTARKDLVEEVNRHNEIKILYNNILLDIQGQENLSKIVLSDTGTTDISELEIDKLILKLGYLPNSQFVESGIDLDAKGYVIVNEKYQTSNKFVYAIGDIVSGVYKRISIAQGQGTSLGTFFLKELLS